MKVAGISSTENIKPDKPDKPKDSKESPIDKESLKAMIIQAIANRQPITESKPAEQIHNISVNKDLYNPLLKTTLIENKCSRCGANVSAGQRYCDLCAKKLAGSAYGL